MRELSRVCQSVTPSEPSLLLIRIISGQVKPGFLDDFVVLLEEMFPQVVGLDAAVSTVGTGVGSLTRVSHRVGLQSSGLSESFPTVRAGQFGLSMGLHVFLEVVLGRALIVAVSVLAPIFAVECFVLRVFEQHMSVMIIFH